MTKEQQYWEDAQEALTRLFNRCEEIDPHSGYDMLEDIRFVRGFINKHKPQAESVDKNATLRLGKTYEFAGYNWVVAELFSDYAVLQSTGVTHGAWADNFDSYDEKIQTLYSTIKDVDYTNKGLYLISKDQCKGFYRDALQKAALNYSSFGASYSNAWIGTPYNDSYAWSIGSGGDFNRDNMSYSCVVVAPAFNVAMSKIEVVGDKIVIVNEGKPCNDAVTDDIASARRGWCNGSFRESIPSDLRGIFKQVDISTVDTD